MEYDNCFSIICNCCGEIFPASSEHMKYNEYEDKNTGEVDSFNIIMCPACTVVEVLDPS